MIKEVRLPEISENVESGDLVKVLVSPGDTVELDQPLIELETDKAVFEVPSTVAGIIAEIMVKPGDVVNVGDVIARVDTAGAVEADPPAGDKKPAEDPAPLPEVVALPESNPEPDTAPAPSPAPAPVAAPEPATAAAEPAAVQPVPAASVQKSGPAPASPTVRRLARELGVDIHQVAGGGPGGRISSDDVHRFAKALITGAAGAASTVAMPTVSVPGATISLPDFSKFGEIERVTMSKIRSVTARNLAAAWNTVPHVTQHDECDITDLEAARKKYGKLAEKAGGKMTMTSILLKVCAGALARFPDFNASIDTARQEIVYKKYINIGIAVDTERGLLVPSIRHVDQKNIVALSVEVTEIAARARDKKITPADLEGGCFTISNLGGIGGTSFTPIVYAPEVAILGVSRARMQPVYRGTKEHGDPRKRRDGEFVPRLMMPLSLSYDHRLIDGAAAARFLRWICDVLEDPILLAIDG